MGILRGTPSLAGRTVLYLIKAFKIFVWRPRYFTSEEILQPPGQVTVAASYTLFFTRLLFMLPRPAQASVSVNPHPRASASSRNYLVIYLFIY